jgi:hypothetical protein
MMFKVKAKKAPQSGIAKLSKAGYPLDKAMAMTAKKKDAPKKKKKNG